MSLLQHAPAFDSEYASKIVRELYALTGPATPLPSERDQNFRIDTDGGTFVLKIANATEERLMLEAQNAAMRHLSERLAFCPRVARNLEGDEIAVSAGHLVRLVTWLPGVTLGSVGRRPPELLADLGLHIAQMDRALASFEHPALDRHFHWDLAHAPEVIAQYIGRVSDPTLRTLIEALVARIERDAASSLAALPRSAIHNDPNDYNVLVDGPAVTGIIDFGDMVRSYTVADLAVAIAYAVLPATDALATAASVTRGYHAARPLDQQEIAAILPLVQLRLCLSACLAAHQHAQRPDDEYLRISQDGIRRALPILAAADPGAAEAALRTACREADTLQRRRTHVGAAVRLTYRDPLMLVRGQMQYVFDAQGRRYLDAYNNVPHVGHCHPRVVDAATTQMRRLNTNTRYLHDALACYAEQLVSTLPSPLRVCYFVNSGSEANELALRLARAHTRHQDVVVLEAAYHGHTTTLIDISPYKFEGPGGTGKRPWVHVVSVPDVYRGVYRTHGSSRSRGRLPEGNADQPPPRLRRSAEASAEAEGATSEVTNDAHLGASYAESVAEAIQRLHADGRGLAAFIAETCPSVAGQIVFPPGYLPAVYAHVREAGGVCIADEVQTAYGRMGTSFYAFEDQHVVPDVVVLGKPIGNGYPIGAVITTEAIATSFDNGMEFFSTFGGSTVSCAVGLAVLDIIRDEGLQARARAVGEGMRAQFRTLADRHRLIGDVRGSGLFLGIELVRDQISLEPASAEAAYVVNRMREEGILLGTDGPFHNVLKVRPPMPFGPADGDRLAGVLDGVLTELDG